MADRGRTETENEREWELEEPIERMIVVGTDDDFVNFSAPKIIERQMFSLDSLRTEFKSEFIYICTNTNIQHIHQQ